MWVPIYYKAFRSFSKKIKKIRTLIFTLDVIFSFFINEKQQLLFLLKHIAIIENYNIFIR